MRFTTAIVAMIMLSSCQHQAEVSLFTADLAAAARGTDGLQAVAVLRLSAGSEAACTEHTTAIAEALSKGFTEVTSLGCSKSGFETFAEYRARIAITPIDAAENTALYIGTRITDGITVAILQLDKAAIDRIISALPPALNSGIYGPPKFAVSVVVQNDLAEPAKISVNGVFLDGQPQPQFHDVTLDRRSETKIALSDVGNAALALGAAPLFAMQP